MRFLALLSLALTLTVCASPTAKSLSAFSQVQVCTPFNVVIAPATSKTSPYTLSIDADGAVQKAVGASVKNGVLSLQSTGSFNTPNPIKVTVRLPADKLTGVTVSSATGITVVVDKGFSLKALSAQVKGSGDLVIKSIKTASLKIGNSGVGDISINGSIGKADITASGTGVTYLAGASGPVSVSASGTSSVRINSPSDKVQITGKVTGISSLDYNRGSCKLSATDLAEACNKKTVKAPTLTTLWTCGLQLSGTFGCSTSGSTSSSSSTGGDSSTGSTHTSSSGGGTSSGSTHTSSSGGGSASAFSSSSSSSSGSSSSSSSSGGGIPDDFFDNFVFASVPTKTSSSSSSSSPGSSTVTTDTGKLSSQKCAVATKSLNMVS